MLAQQQSSSSKKRKIGNTHSLRVDLPHTHKKIALVLKEQINKLAFIKLKSSALQKSLLRKATDLEKIFAKTHLINNCYPKYKRSFKTSILEPTSGLD